MMQYLLSLIILLFSFQISYAGNYFTKREAYFQRHLMMYVGMDLESRGISASTFFYGLSYKLGGFKNRADIQLRLRVHQFSEKKKISLLPLVIFPDIDSRFPLYFGGGFGGGLILEENLQPSFDYHILTGFRWFHLKRQHLGLFIESGIKGSIYFLKKENPYFSYLTLGIHFVF